MESYNITINTGEAQDLERLYSARLTGYVSVTAGIEDTLFLVLRALILEGYEPVLDVTKGTLRGQT